ncbi:phospholipase effector Tle1 domain-containing protein [Marinobacter sp. MBR-105]
MCADGTWQSPESSTSTHILRLAEGLAPEDASGNQQVVFYDWGVGSEGDTFSGGVTGKGIDKNIMDCYRFIVHNYDEGDALYLFGFSRGAYTVRSVADISRIHFIGVYDTAEIQVVE